MNFRIWARMVAVTWMASGCSDVGRSSQDAGAPDFARIDVRGNERAYLNNLVGRWFTDAEIARLDDDTLTREEWCARAPAYILVLLDSVMVRCENQHEYQAGISRVSGNNGSITITLRAKEESKLRQVVFRNVFGTRALVSGSPCAAGELSYSRFPKIEILNRQILNGSSCAQVQGGLPIPVE